MILEEHRPAGGLHEEISEKKYCHRDNYWNFNVKKIEIGTRKDINQHKLTTYHSDILVVSFLKNVLHFEINCFLMNNISLRRSILGGRQ